MNKKNWINPATVHEAFSSYILYTKKEGGEFKVVSFGTLAANKMIFKEAKKDGYLKIKTGDFDPEPTYIAYIALVKIVDNWDFVIEKLNKERRDD